MIKYLSTNVTRRIVAILLDIGSVSAAAVMNHGKAEYACIKALTNGVNKRDGWHRGYG